MNSKIIIVRMIKTFDGINHLEESLNKKEERYYIVCDDDTDIVKQNNELSCLTAFVIYDACTEEKVDRIEKIYIGNGRIADDDKGWRIYYKIENLFDSKMIINNFVSNSELDLKHDFDSHSFVMIENNAELVNQMSFITFPTYKATVISPEEQSYPKIDREKSLHEYSQKNEHCKRPIGKITSQEHRPEFQRDYERIIHAKAYRRLVDKAQIFTSSKGDHYRTRMTHTLEVAQISRAIATGLNLNVELTEAIALAHDLGHTPFGHQGERSLDDILKGKKDIIKYSPEEKNPFGGFKHSFQGLRVANYLEDKYIEFDGLDLSYQVLEGILKHTKLKIKNCANCNKCDKKCFDIKEFMPSDSIEYLYPEITHPTTLEGQIVAIADEIAQRSHDLDDAFASKILSTQQLSNYLSLNKTQALHNTLDKIEEIMNEVKNNHRVYVAEDELKNSRMVSEVIKYFINNVIEESNKKINEFVPNDFYNQNHRFDKELISFSREGAILCNYLEKIISKKVISNSEVVSFDNKGDIIITQLFQAYYNNPKLLHKGTLRKIYINMRQHTNHVIDFIEGDRDEVKEEIKKIVDTNLLNLDETEREEYLQKKKILVRAIADYISGMTDSYALNEYHSLFQ